MRQSAVTGNGADHLNVPANGRPSYVSAKARAGEVQISANGRPEAIPILKAWIAADVPLIAARIWPMWRRTRTITLDRTLTLELKVQLHLRAQ